MVRLGNSGLDLLENLLRFVPDERPTVEEALEHPYLENYHSIQDEPITRPFDFSFEVLETIDEMKTAISRQVYTFQPKNSNVHRISGL